MNDICKLTIHRFGESATHSLARLERRLTLPLLLRRRFSCQSPFQTRYRVRPTEESRFKMVSVTKG